jgi:hypothetical protein
LMFARVSLSSIGGSSMALMQPSKSKRPQVVLSPVDARLAVSGSPTSLPATRDSVVFLRCLSGCLVQKKVDHVVIFLFFEVFFL